MERNNFEHSSGNSIEQEYIIDAAHKTLEHQKQYYQPNPESFLEEEGYNKAEIEREIAITKSLKEQWGSENSDFEKKNKKISDVFEGIVVDQFCGEWMANKAEAFFTAEADDYLRKVDCVIEFAPDEESEKPEYLGLGIDVTFSSDYSTVRNKLDDIWTNDIQRGRQVPIKYVETDHHKGSMDVCRTVLLADKETVYKLARLYTTKNKEELNNHEYLANALFQIKYQLESYLRYAQQNGLKGSYLQSIAKTLGTFYKVYDEKQEFLDSHVNDVLATDTFKTVQSYCDNKLREK